MHPTTLEYLVKASQDDTRRACKQGRLLKEVRRARRASAHPPGPPAPAHPSGAVRRLLTALGARTIA
jgi:hypothetical protein